MSELRFDRPVEYVENPGFLVNIMFEVTNACNHSCVFCHNKEQKRNVVMSDKILFSRLIDEAYSNGAREIGFYMNGEPFLCKDLNSYVKQANETGYDYIYITTNGSLSDLKTLRDLIENGLSSIKFSVNAASRETYRMIHGKDDFDKVKQNILDIGNARRKDGLDISLFISFIRNKLNQGEEEKLQEQFGSYVDRIYLFDLSNQGGMMRKIQIC